MINGPQVETAHYFRTMPLPDHVVVEVWSTDEDCGEKCLDPQCFAVGFVHIAGQPYCLRHARLVVTGMPEGARRHVSIDVGRPIINSVVDDDKLIDTLKEARRVLASFIERGNGSLVTKTQWIAANRAHRLCDEALKQQLGE